MDGFVEEDGFCSKGPLMAHRTSHNEYLTRRGSWKRTLGPTRRTPIQIHSRTIKYGVVDMESDVLEALRDPLDIYLVQYILASQRWYVDSAICHSCS